jgi:hypothetical protein
MNKQHNLPYPVDAHRAGNLRFGYLVDDSYF